MQAHQTWAVLIKLRSIHPRDLLTPIIRLTPLPSSTQTWTPTTILYPPPTPHTPPSLCSKLQRPALRRADGSVCFSVCCLSCIGAVFIVILTRVYYCVQGSLQTSATLGEKKPQHVWQKRTMFPSKHKLHISLTIKASFCSFTQLRFLSQREQDSCYPSAQNGDTDGCPLRSKLYDFTHSKHSVEPPINMFLDF